MTDKPCLIDLQHVGKTYKTGPIVFEALKDLNLTIKHGEYLSILGPSGSGKSTLMNILGCLDKPTVGSYKLNGKEIREMNRTELAIIRSEYIGFIFQTFHLLPHASAIENVALPLVYRGVGVSKRHERAKELLDMLGLGSRLKNKPNELSGGQRQRVAIARALVGDPDVIFADEPTGNLDSKSGEEVIKIFEDLSKQGKTLIIVTHDNKMAERTNRIITIRDGVVESDEQRGSGTN
jgi:putative ABC transport system ATP-binding protein